MYADRELYDWSKTLDEFMTEGLDIESLADGPAAPVQASAVSSVVVNNNIGLEALTGFENRHVEAYDDSIIDYRLIEID